MLFTLVAFRIVVGIHCNFNYTNAQLPFSSFYLFLDFGVIVFIFAVISISEHYGNRNINNSIISIDINSLRKENYTKTQEMGNQDLLIDCG